ncbi:MAG: sigma-54-dependent Fis family transcriptional regulator [Rickettsiales bacterium]|nr:sigma-54-dependent Fis family transcriptional regulator [Rickettsiales bacterium]|tara:strand:- start:215 stop:1669 length:1455 start_codon:yes stop_codon:yes gene_type:complete
MQLLEKKILLVEDTKSLSMMYEEILTSEGYEVILAETGAQAIETLNEDLFGLILLDLKLPDHDGMDILRTMPSLNENTPVIMMTAFGSVNHAVEAMQLGAKDFLIKPFNKDRLLITVSNVLEANNLKKIVNDIEKSNRNQFEGFVGNSAIMQTVYRMIENAANSKATIFITGESGTGKEVCAQAIHSQSKRAGKAFVPINCGAIPKDLMESEIFGHIKGSFTGAISDRDGAAKVADGGTLFLDEICEMDLDLQTKLLRFIQTGQFKPVGSNKLLKTDIRIVCATNRDPLKEVELGNFREDLYYRLHVIPIELPPLRERGKDILKLANYFLSQYMKEEEKEFEGFDINLEQFFLHYGWPGNIRELQNVVRTSVVLQNGAYITAESLPQKTKLEFNNFVNDSGEGFVVSIEEAQSKNNNNEGNSEMNSRYFKRTSDIRPLWLIEKETIEQAIDVCDGNIPKAASLLEISPSTIYRKKATWEELSKK